MTYTEYSESIGIIVSGATYTVPFPESDLKGGAYNELVISFASAMAEEIEIIIDGTTIGLFGSGGYFVSEKKDKRFFRHVQLKNTGVPASNTTADEIKLQARRVV